MRIIVGLAAALSLLAPAPSAPAQAEPACVRGYTNRGWQQS